MRVFMGEGGVCEGKKIGIGKRKRERKGKKGKEREREEEKEEEREKKTKEVEGKKERIARISDPRTWVLFSFFRFLFQRA